MWWVGGVRVDTFVNSDMLVYWAPLQRQVAAQWLAGRLPLWNPYQGFGTPLLATAQIGAAYPFNLLYLVCDLGWAWLLTGVLHQLIATVGMYAFGRALELRPAAALVGAASYAFAAGVIGQYLDQPQFLCSAWIPAMFACAERLLRAPRIQVAVCLAYVWALQVLAGHPETIVHSAIVLGTYVGVRLLVSVVHAPRDAVRTGAAALAAAGLALGLSAFQWLPTLELLQRSVRAIGSLTPGQQVMLSIDPWQLLTAAQGAAPLFLAGVGLWTWARRLEARLFAGIAVALAILAAGPATALFEVVRHVPTGSWFRAPGRWLHLWPLCIAVLSGAGAQALLTLPRRLVVVAGSALFAVTARLIVMPHTGLTAATAAGIACELLPLLFLAAVQSVLRAAPGDRACAAVLIAALVAPAFFHPRYLSPFGVAPRYDEQRELLDALRREAPARVLSLLPLADRGTWAKLGSYFDVPVLNDLEPLSLGDFRTFVSALSRPPAPAAGFAAGLGVFMGTIGAPERSFDARLLNLSGVRFVIMDPASEPHVATWFDAPALAPWRRSDAAVVYENRNVQPRAFFVAVNAVRVPGRSCIDDLRAPGFDPRREVLLASAPEPVAGAGVAASTQVSIIGYAPNEVRLAVSAPQPGYVVVTDAFYPGWQASVDGAAAAVLRADCFFRAVPVAAGTHDVVLRYAPRSLAFGALVSLLAFGGAAVALWVTRVVRRP